MPAQCESLKHGAHLHQQASGSGGAGQSEAKFEQAPSFSTLIPVANASHSLAKSVPSQPHTGTGLHAGASSQLPSPRHEPEGRTQRDPAGPASTQSMSDQHRPAIGRSAHCAPSRRSASAAPSRRAASDPPASRISASPRPAPASSPCSVASMRGPASSSPSGSDKSSVRPQPTTVNALTTPRIRCTPKHTPRHLGRAWPAGVPETLAGPVPEILAGPRSTFALASRGVIEMVKRHEAQVLRRIESEAPVRDLDTAAERDAARRAAHRSPSHSGTGSWGCSVGSRRSRPSRTIQPRGLRFAPRPSRGRSRRRLRVPLTAAGSAARVALSDVELRAPASATPCLPAQVSPALVLVFYDPKIRSWTSKPAARRAATVDVARIGTRHLTRCAGPADHVRAGSGCDDACGSIAGHVAARPSVETALGTAGAVEVAGVRTYGITHAAGLAGEIVAAHRVEFAGSPHLARAVASRARAAVSGAGNGGGTGARKGDNGGGDEHRRPKGMHADSFCWLGLRPIRYGEPSIVRAATA